MLTKNKIIGIVRKELPFLRKEFGVKEIAIFGSFAQNRQHAKSDIDIFIKFERTLGLKYFDLMDYLEKILGRKTDVLTAQGLNSIRVKKVAQEIRKSLIYV